MGPSTLAERIASTYGRLRLRTCSGRPAGFLVALEGIDGSGVTTHGRILADTLAALGAETVYTKEPTQCPTGRLIWEILRGRHPELRDPLILAHLFAADRATHLYREGGVVESLQKGAIVVMDRYKYSSIAYQSVPLPGAQPPPSMEHLLVLNQAAPPAHLLVYIDVDPGEAAERIAGRRETHIYEAPGILARVRESYLGLLRRLAREPEYPASPEPAWVARVPGAGCVYRGGPWPRVVVVRGRRGVWETAELLVWAVVAVAVDTGLLETHK